MPRKSNVPTCRYCGKPGAPRKCSLCGRVKCAGCVKADPKGDDCQACRIGIYTTFAGKRIRLRVAHGDRLYSACGDVAKSAPILVEYYVPEAIEEAGRLKYVLGTRGYLNVTLEERKSNGQAQER